MGESENKVCKKCGSSEWGLWISSSGKIKTDCAYMKVRKKDTLVP